MASIVKSGNNNVSYTNDTGVNVRVLINYMASCTSMTWAGVTIEEGTSTVGKDTWTINGGFGGFTEDTKKPVPGEPVVGGTIYKYKLEVGNDEILAKLDTSYSVPRYTTITNIGNIASRIIGFFEYGPGGVGGGGQGGPWAYGDAGIYYIPQTITPGGKYPTEIILANGESFSAVCGAYNIVVIREDGN